MDELRTKQYKIITVLIGLSLLTVCCLFIIAPTQAITLDEIKQYVMPSSSSGGVVNNYYSNNYQTNYTINVQALTSSPADNVKNYFGTKPSAFTTTAGQNKIYFRKACNITAVEVYQYSGTAGTAEKYNLTIYKNNAAQNSNGFIAELTSATNERIFTNRSLNLAVAKDDYIELVFFNPPWFTNPLTTITGGYMVISP